MVTNALRDSKPRYRPAPIFTDTTTGVKEDELVQSPYGRYHYANLDPAEQERLSQKHKKQELLKASLAEQVAVRRPMKTPTLPFPTLRP